MTHRHSDINTDCFFHLGLRAKLREGRRLQKNTRNYCKIDENKNQTQCEDGAAILTGAVGRVVERFPLRKTKRDSYKDEVLLTGLFSLHIYFVISRFAE